MFPHERSLVKQLAGKPFALIGVNSDADREALRETIKEKNITWRSFWNGEEGTSGPISTKWGVRGWPTIYVLDAEGTIRYKNVRGEKMDEAVTNLLGELGHVVTIVHEEEDEGQQAGDDEGGDDDDGAGDDDDGDDDDDGEGDGQ